MTCLRVPSEPRATPVEGTRVPRCLSSLVMSLRERCVLGRKRSYCLSVVQTLETAERSDFLPHLTCSVGRESGTGRMPPEVTWRRASVTWCGRRSTLRIRHILVLHAISLHFSVHQPQSKAVALRGKALHLSGRISYPCLLLTFRDRIECCGLD
jgi:hypothetical protein